LEDRTVPAFNMTLSFNATAGVNVATMAGTTTFTANAAGANVSWGDIQGQLAAGKNVVVDSGSTGTEAGNITDLVGIQMPGLAPGVSLTFQTGSGANLVGDVLIIGCFMESTNASFTITANRNIAVGLIGAGTNMTPLPLANATYASATGSVMRGGVVGPTFADKLAITAATGIGAVGTPLFGQVNNLEAQTTTGGVFFTNAKALTIGGVNGALNGVQNTGASGAIQIDASGKLTVSEKVRAPGNITLLANGATSDFTSQAGIDGLTSTGGTTTIQAGQDLVLGTATNSGDVRGQTVELTAGRDIVVDNSTFVQADGAGGVQGTAGGSFKVLNAIAAGSVINSNGSGPISIKTGSGQTFTLDSGAGGQIATNGGSITISADDMVINNSINGGASTVTLQQANTTSRQISLGGGAAAGSLGISDTELGRITAGVVRIGRTDNPGDLSLDGAVTTHAGFNTLSLRTGGAIRDDNLGTDITVANLAMQAAKGIGDSGTFNIVDVQVTKVAFANTISGLAQISDGGGGLIVAAVDQITTTSTAAKGGTIIAASPLTIAMDVLLGGSMTFVAGDSAAPGDDLTIKNGVTVTLDSAVNSTLSFIAGDDIVFEGTGNILTKGAAGHKVQLSADNENNLGDGDGGTITQDTAATISVTTNFLEMTPRASIGTPAIRFHFNVDSLTTESTLGSQFLREANGVTATSLKASGAGNDIDLIVDLGDLAVDTITAADQVVLKATTGKITDANAGNTNVTAIGLTATAKSGIDLDTKVDTISANTTDAGAIALDEFDGVTLTNVTAANGPITITTGGNTAITNVVSSTDNDANDISITATAGDITVTTVDAGTAAGDVLIKATAGSIFDDGVNGTLISGDVVTLTADRAIGQPGATAQMDTTANSWVLSTTVPGPFAGVPTPGIWATDTNAVTVTSATTADGIIVLTSGGQMTATSVTAGGAGRNLRLQTTAGNLLLGAVSADGDSALLQAAGAIVDNNGAANNVTANNLTLTAGTGIGVGDAIEAKVSNLAGASSAGNIEVANSIAVTVTELTTFGVTITGIKTTNDVVISADELAVIKAISGACVIIQTNSDNTVNARLGANAAGELSLDQAELDLITANIFQFGGSLAGTNRSKTATIAAAINVTTAPTLDIRSAGTISDNAGAGTVKVNNLAFAAGDTVTLNGANDVNVLAGTTTKGDILFRDVDDVTIGAVTVCDGVVNQLTAPGKIMVTADAPDITITVIGDCVIIDTNTVGNIDLGTTLDNADLGNITARVLQIGNTNAQNITVSAAISISAAKVTNVNLIAQKDALTTGGTISADRLAITAVGLVNFTGGNDVNRLAGSAGGDFTFEDDDDLTINKVDLCVGDISDVSGKGVNLTANDLTNVGKITATAKDIVLTADQMELQNDVSAAAGCVTLQQRTTARPINLGTNSAIELSLRDDELDRITTMMGLTIGLPTGGAIDVSNTISINDQLRLLAGTGGIAGAGALELSDLQLQSGGSVGLTGSNKVANIAGTSATQFVFNAVESFTVNSVTVCGTTIAGITTTAGDATLSTTKAITIAKNITAPGSTIQLKAGTGVTETTGIVLSTNLELLGAGAFTLANAGNDVANLRVDINGPFNYRDANDLAIPALLKTNNNNALLNLGGSLDFSDSKAEINVGAANTATVFVGLNGNVTTNILSGIFKAASFTITGNNANDAFTKVRPSETTPLFINGGLPTPPTFPGDSLGTQVVPMAAITFVYDPITGNGSIDYGGVRQKITFTSIESVLGLSIQAVVTQTSNNTSAIEAVGTLNGQPLVGGLTDSPPTAPPFLVAPSFANPILPYRAPSLAIGDADGDGIPDLIVGNGPNFGGPLVTVISGQRILLAANQNLPTSQFLLAQFFAYDPTFNGGVFVSAADILPDPVGKRVEIVTGAGETGGPHVVVFQLTGTANPAMNKMLTVSKGPQFFAYGAGFRGGVRVATGDVNGDGVPDIVTAAGPGGGPHVRVIDGKNLQANKIVQAAEFFAYDAGFRGGVFVDVGDVANGVNSFTPDGFADIATGAGYGGGPHIKIFDGKRLTQPGPTVQVDWQFFDAPFVVPSVPTPYEEGVYTLTAGVSGVGLSDADGDGLFDLYVGSGLGRKSRFRIYKLGNATPINGLLGSKVANSDLNYGVFVSTSGANLS
jgi:hypothetical protein